MCSSVISLKGKTVSAPTFVLYPVILPVESITGVNPPKLSFCEQMFFVRKCKEMNTYRRQEK